MVKLKILTTLNITFTLAVMCVYNMFLLIFRKKDLYRTNYSFIVASYVNKTNMCKVLFTYLYFIDKMLKYVVVFLHVDGHQIESSRMKITQLC